MPDPLQELFDAVRAACSPAIWSRGVELARAEAVQGESDDGSEVALRVSTPSGLLAPKVILAPDDVAWECDCAGHEDVCEHVAAAVIALRRVRSEGAALPRTGRQTGRVGYRLARAAGAIHFERCAVIGEREVPLASTLGAIASGRVDGPELLATEADLGVERALGTRLRGALPRGVWPGVLAALSRCADVRLDGEPVQARDERVGWMGVLEDQGDGFRLSVAPDSRIRESFDDELVLVDDVLCLRGTSRLTGRELEDLRPGRHFAPDEAARLVTEVLPSLAERIPVEVRTQRLPSTREVPPRIALEVTREGDALSVFPTLVYGDPPLARIDAGRLVPLGGPIPLRDEVRERALLRQLQNELELLPGRRVALRGEEAVAMAEKLAGWRGALRGDGLETFHRAAPLEPRFTADGEGLGLRFESAGSERGVDAAPVLRAWREGESLVPLPGGGFAPLPADWLARFGHRVADLLAASDANGALPRAALPDLAHLCEDLDAELPAELAALCERIEHLHEATHAEPPGDLQAQLRRYQQRGVDWLCALREAQLGALLADDMGLGKTLQALCAIRGRTLVVAPTSVLHNWAAEIGRFRPSLHCALYHGASRRLDPEADVTLTSYAILRLDAEPLGAVAWDAVVLDEAQAIKNPESQVARAAYGLRGGQRIALTGTPVENRLDELWSQFHFINRGLLGGRRDFEERYARPIAAGEADAADRLRRRIRPFVLRRLKREVAPELPPRTESVLRVSLDEQEQRVYDAVRAATRSEVLEQLAAGRGVLQALEALLRLRQAACHTALVPGQRAASSSKLELLLESLDEALAEGHRALVFSQWTSLLDLVAPKLDAAGIAYTRLDGATRDRGAVVESFQAEDGPPVMLLSLKAGGVGLNLTAADCVFVLDPWWNPAAEDQAADRAHRIGQERPVMVYRLVTADTVEERILALQKRKRGLAEAALGGGEVAGRLAREELLELLA
ncbi:MAG TPA: DEAD/DEAH box helicase [Myxococcota bacterium]